MIISISMVVGIDIPKPEVTSPMMDELMDEILLQSIRDNFRDAFTNEGSTILSLEVNQSTELFKGRVTK